ncbi:efflux RND transporter periplasmic adaptor subunit [Thauera humireducens]|uniref:efflux RND transporter periplasmic adaptor subunit n=1 Tax=Thauera humireducens TaxID=1134435 RepID=UPI00311FCD98
MAPRFDGWIERLHVRAVGDVVRKGQPLFEYLQPRAAVGGRGVAHRRASAARQQRRPGGG